MTADWEWILHDHSGVEEAAPDLSGRTVTWRLDAQSEAAATMTLTDPLVGFVAPFATDLRIQRDGTDVFRGRVGDPAIAMSATTNTLSLAAVDYRGLLDQLARTDPAGVDYTATDQADIAWGLIAAYQARAGGNLGITRGIGTVSGKTRDRTYEGSAPIGDLITKLGQVIDGFEWQINPALELDMWHAPTIRGRTDQAVLSRGAGIAAATRQPLPGYGSAWTAHGAEGTTPATAVAADIATDPRGRWERAAAYQSITSQDVLDDRAGWLLEHGRGPSQWILTLEAGWWEGPDGLWIGDTFTLDLQYGALTVFGTYRVIELAVALGDSDEETVTIGALEVLT